MAKKTKAKAARSASKTKRASAASKKATKAKKTRPTAARKAAPAKKRTTPGANTSANRAAPSVPPSPALGPGKVSVRMYRGLLGDFFLVRHTSGNNQFKMLIDCGVLQCIGTAQAKPSTSRGKQRIVAGVADFMRETGGQLDLVVATHEHYDHLSGFMLANDAFKDLKIGKVWMAWTEDRTDKLANSYRSKNKKALTALAALTQNPALAASDEMETVRNLLQFYGDIESMRSSALGMAKPTNGSKLSGNASCEAVLEWLRQKAGASNVSFLKPGEVVRWGVNDAFRAYVLGPPREDEFLRKLDPSPGAQREVYLARPEDVETVWGLAAIHGYLNGSADEAEQPFTPPYRRPYHDGDKRHAKKRVKSPDDLIVRLYRSKQDFDRSIDQEWLGSAENLALKIDGDVNNTSLALALELADRRVLLFPGDAQVGNWLSWGHQTYATDGADRNAKLKIEELLARTVLYKVGHHASHNATLRERGLELMSNRDLCAMIPVVEQTAREQKTKNSPKGWAMPYGGLYKRLEERTEGRVVRGDGDTKEEQSKFKKSIFDVSYGLNFAAGDPLWVELALTV
jgi:hypothetical protein